MKSADEGFIAPLTREEEDRAARLLLQHSLPSDKSLPYQPLAVTYEIVLPRYAAEALHRDLYNRDDKSSFYSWLEYRAVNIEYPKAGSWVLTFTVEATILDTLNRVTVEEIYAELDRRVNLNGYHLLKSPRDVDGPTKGKVL